MGCGRVWGVPWCVEIFFVFALEVPWECWCLIRVWKYFIGV